MFSKWKTQLRKKTIIWQSLKISFCNWRKLLMQKMMCPYSISTQNKKGGLPPPPPPPPIAKLIHYYGWLFIHHNNEYSFLDKQLYCLLPNELQNYICRFLPKHPIVKHVYNGSCILCHHKPATFIYNNDTYMNDSYCKHYFCYPCLFRLTTNETRKVRHCPKCRGSIEDLTYKFYDTDDDGGSSDDDSTDK